MKSCPKKIEPLFSREQSQVGGREFHLERKEASDSRVKFECGRRRHEYNWHDHMLITSIPSNESWIKAFGYSEPPYHSQKGCTNCGTDRVPLSRTNRSRCSLNKFAHTTLEKTKPSITTNFCLKTSLIPLCIGKALVWFSSRIPRSDNHCMEASKQHMQAVGANSKSELFLLPLSRASNCELSNMYGRLTKRHEYNYNGMAKVFFVAHANHLCSWHDGWEVKQYMRQFCSLWRTIQVQDASDFWLHFHWLLTPSP